MGNAKFSAKFLVAKFLVAKFLWTKSVSLRMTCPKPGNLSGA
jgi:hypothetical protein